MLAARTWPAAASRMHTVYGIRQHGARVEFVFGGGGGDRNWAAAISAHSSAGQLFVVFGMGGRSCFVRPYYVLRSATVTLTRFQEQARGADEPPNWPLSGQVASGLTFGSMRGDFFRMKSQPPISRAHGIKQSLASPQTTTTTTEKKSNLRRAPAHREHLRVVEQGDDIKVVYF